jgi:hypothetical protein
MNNVSDKSCIENQTMHLMFNNFFPENRDFYDKMRKNMVDLDKPHVAA